MIAAGVSTKHEQYEEYHPVWQEMRDHLAGSRAIKSKGTEYLPMLGDQNSQEDQQNYQSYLKRALYYEATKRTQAALLGALMMKPPQFHGIDSKYTDMFSQVTMEGYSMETFIRNMLSELIGLSFTGALVERSTQDNGGELYFVQYKAESILNWRFQRVGDKIKLTLVVLEEKYIEETGRFESEEKTRYRVLELIDGVYTQSVFNEVMGDDEAVYLVESDDTIVPANVGAPLDEIPFVFFTPLGNVPEVVEPVLSSIATINTSHYMSSADLEHGRHFTGLPTAWVAGFDTDTKLSIGSQVAWVSEDPNARAGFLEFLGTGLNSLVMALAEKQEQMATMGARMLRAPRTGVEAAETARIYQSAESGTLTGLAKAASESFTALIGYWLRWQGVEDLSDVNVELNTDYVDTRLDPTALTALVSSWMSGAISYDTLFYNLQHGEVIPDGIDSETERDLIETQKPVVDESDPIQPTGQ